MKKHVFFYTLFLVGLLALPSKAQVTFHFVNADGFAIEHIAYRFDLSTRTDNFTLYDLTGEHPLKGYSEDGIYRIPGMISENYIGWLRLNGADSEEGFSLSAGTEEGPKTYRLAIKATHRDSGKSIFLVSGSEKHPHIAFFLEEDNQPILKVPTLEAEQVSKMIWQSTSQQYLAVKYDNFSNEPTGDSFDISINTEQIKEGAKTYLKGNIIIDKQGEITVYEIEKTLVEG